MQSSCTCAAPARRWLALGLFLMTATADLPVARALTLEDSIEAALATNPEVGVVEADRQAIDQELRQARALYFPSIDLRGAIGPEYTNSPATRRVFGAGDSSETLLRMESQITLSQMLFDGFSTRSEVDRQVARIDSAAYRVREASEFIALDAIEAHLNVLRNQALVELAEQNVVEHQRILGQVTQLEREGGGTIADVRQTEARVAAARAALAVAFGNLREAEAVYRAVVGIPPEDLERPEPPLAAVPGSAEMAATDASAGNPTVRIADADIEVAKAELEGARSGYYPRLDLEMGAGANRNLDGIEGSDVDAQALLVLRYNLFRGGGDIAREREAFARLREAREVLLRARRDAEEDARIAHSAYLTAQERFDALEAQADATRSTRDAYAQQFDLGQRSLLDLLDSENELFLARSNLVTAQYTALFAVYRLLAATGELLMVLDIDAAAESINIYRKPEDSIHEAPPVTVERRGPA
jgi:adhesin transport system outer membrane protein